MEATRFMIPFALIGILQFGMDLYIIHNFRRMIRERGLSKWWYISPLILSILLLAALPYYGWLRVTKGVPTTISNILSVIYSVWLLPKVLIFFFLLVKDTLNFLRKLYFILSQKLFPARAIEINSEALLQTNDRRKFLQNVGWTLASAPYLALGNGLMRTTYNFQTYRVNVPIRNLPRQFEGLTIAQISDIHAGSFIGNSPLQEIFRVTQETKADLIFITGDWVNFKPEELELYLPQFAKFKAPLGVYGCLGNHDHYMSDNEHKQLVSAIKSAPINLLINENTTFSVDGAKLQLAATDFTGMNMNFADLESATAGLSPDFPTILMAHDPSYWDKKVRSKTKIDLMLAGHTHGGQFGMHFLDKELSLAQVAYKQWAGLYSDGNQHLYVNRGVGTTGFPVRVGISPEITLMTLKKAV